MCNSYQRFQEISPGDFQDFPAEWWQVTTVQVTALQSCWEQLIWSWQQIGALKVSISFFPLPTLYCATEQSRDLSHTGQLCCPHWFDVGLVEIHAGNWEKVVVVLVWACFLTSTQGCRDCLSGEWGWTPHVTQGGRLDDKSFLPNHTCGVTAPPSVSWPWLYISTIPVSPVLL